jgi:hypothetical protein
MLCPAIAVDAHAPDLARWNVLPVHIDANCPANFSGAGPRSCLLTSYSVQLAAASEAEAGEGEAEINAGRP